MNELISPAKVECSVRPRMFLGYSARLCDERQGRWDERQKSDEWDGLFHIISLPLQSVHTICRP